MFTIAGAFITCARSERSRCCERGAWTHGEGSRRLQRLAIITTIRVIHIAITRLMTAAGRPRCGGRLSSQPSMKGAEAANQLSAGFVSGDPFETIAVELLAFPTAFQLR